MRAINSNWPMLAVQSSFNLSATAHPIFSEDDKAAENECCIYLWLPHNTLLSKPTVTRLNSEQL